MNASRVYREDFNAVSTTEPPDLNQEEAFYQNDFETGPLTIRLVHNSN